MHQPDSLGHGLPNCDELYVELFLELSSEVDSNLSCEIDGESNIDLLSLAQGIYVDSCIFYQILNLYMLIFIVLSFFYLESNKSSPSLTEKHISTKFVDDYSVNEFGWS